MHITAEPSNPLLLLEEALPGVPISSNQILLLLALTLFPVLPEAAILQRPELPWQPRLLPEAVVFLCNGGLLAKMIPTFMAKK